MRRERLKDQIEAPRVSLFDSVVRAVVVLVSLGAIYYAFSGRHAPRPAAEPPAAGAGEPVTIRVTQNHTFYWNQEGPFVLDDFAPRLAAWRKHVQTPRMLITADNSALLADTLRLLNEAQRQGVADVRLEAHPRPPP